MLTSSHAADPGRKPAVPEKVVVVRSRKPGITEARVLRVAAGVSRRLKNSWVDWEDLRQDAALAALEVTAVRRLDPALPVQGYMWRAATRETGLRMSRMIAVPTISEGAAGRARLMAGRVEIDVSGRAKVGRDEDGPALRVEGLEAPEEARPDRDLLWRERERARERLGRLVRRRLDVYLARLPDDQRRGVEALLGRDGPEAADEAEAASRSGTTPEVVRKGYRRIVRWAAGDFELRALRRKMEEEDQDP